MKALAEDALKVEWPGDLIYAFPLPNRIQLVLGRLLEWEGELIMVTPFWPDKSWFPQIMGLATEPPRRF